YDPGNHSLLVIELLTGEEWLVADAFPWGAYYAIIGDEFIFIANVPLSPGDRVIVGGGYKQRVDRVKLLPRQHDVLHEADGDLFVSPWDRAFLPISTTRLAW